MARGLAWLGVEFSEEAVEPVTGYRVDMLLHGGDGGAAGRCAVEVGRAMLSVLYGLWSMVWSLSFVFEREREGGGEGGGRTEGEGGREGEWESGRVGEREGGRERGREGGSMIRCMN